MRRGHPNIGGWRGENNRHFRARNAGTPHFRSSRLYGQADTPRFRPPNPRHYRPVRQYNPPTGHGKDPQSEQRHKNPYRLNNVQRHQENNEHYNHDRQIYNHQNLRDDQYKKYGETNFRNADAYHNDMGDVDFRQPHHAQNSHHNQSSWSIPPPKFDYNKQYHYEGMGAHKTPKSYNMSDEMPLPDYSGHRPPASDHYMATTSTNNNNSQYAHSVDDTVDIVRKRLMNRDKQPCPESPERHQSIEDEDLRINRRQSYHSPPQDQPVKKKIQRQRQNIKLNCDKMKNKIVHQLFKMDKDKIHKLMDNPSSSSKFEYAINTLITEGQNSLNRHMRSVAEKSLYSSSTDFIQDDRNTIYEDTFMKQMQGILDPQDTVLLEDMKPMVMAELSRVLQLELPSEGMTDQGLMQNEQNDSYTNFGETAYDADQYSQHTPYEQSFQSGSSFDNADSIHDGSYHSSYEYEQQLSLESKPLFERRHQKMVEPREEYRSPISKQFRESIDKAFGPVYDDTNRQSPPCDPPIPLFDPNTDQLSDDEDPFAEFDKQYHVAVDHNLIENVSRAPSPQQFLVDTESIDVPINRNTQVITPNISPQKEVKKEIAVPENTLSSNIKKEIDTQVYTIASSPIKIVPSIRNRLKSEPACEKIKTENSEEKHYDSDKFRSEDSLKKAERNEDQKIGHAKSILQSNTRKRSMDQKPSHRKEKRKKRSHSECQEVAKSIVSMFYSNDDHKNSSKEENKEGPTVKTYSDKYVKRKETKKNVKVNNNDSKNEESKKNNLFNHSILSPKDNTNNENQTKGDPKLKLKSIDMFIEQPKKTSVHLAHRNTAVSVNVAKSPEDGKPKPPLTTPSTTIPISRKGDRACKRHISTQVVLKLRNKDTQTIKRKLCVKETQTDPISISSSNNVASNPLERMKDIDMEIQLLLQEKFKLYSSIETKSKTDCIDTMPSLSMRIFNVAQDAETKSDNSEDAIVDDFTSIPTEELEQIALETFTHTDSVTVDKRNRRQKVQQISRKSSESPTTKRKKKVKAPNISLIEKIITDDRPIEDIISLDDLETTPMKTKKKWQTQKRKKTKNLKVSKVIQCPLPADIKPCCVLLRRIDIRPYLKAEKSLVFENNIEYQFEVPIIDGRISQQSETSNITIKQESSCISEVLHHDYTTQNININETTHVSNLNQVEEIVEEVVNDLQFDMLDVSEDIVIGDNCEAKTVDKINDKTITEDIILDNSQSSMEDGTPEAGGVEAECKVFDYATNENLRRDAITVSGNGDAVLAIECIENDFIAACLDGNVYHFNGDGQLLNTLRGSNLAVTCLTIVKEKYGTTVYTGSLDSRIRYYELETGMEKGPECNVLSPIQTMDRAWDTVFVGTRTGFVLQFECKNNMLIPVSTVKFSEQSILALRAMKEGPRKVLLVAARSENVTVRDALTGLLLRTLSGPKMTVYTLLFEDGKVYCGTSSHSIYVFDYTSGSHVGSHEGGKGAVCLRASGGLLFAGCYDGCVYVYREGEAQPLAQLRGPSLMLLSLAIKGTKIIAGYKDRSLYIWKMPLAVLQEMVL